MIYLARLGLVTGGIYLIILIAMFAFQRQLQYFPGHRAPKPQDVGLSAVKVIDLPTPDGETIRLWYAPAANGLPTVLYFHGNAGEIADRADRFAYYQSHGLGVAFLSYRGYGDSTGRISEEGLITDATAAYAWLIAQDIPSVRIMVVGESLGTGVAVQLAAKHPVGGVALEAPYTSTADVAAGIYPWLPVRWLMKDQYRSIDHIAQINAALLIQHGDADQVIPYAFGQQLFAAAAAPKTFETLPDQGHEALFQPEIWAREVAFFAQIPENQHRPIAPPCDTLPRALP